MYHIPKWNFWSGYLNKFFVNLNDSFYWYYLAAIHYLDIDLSLTIGNPWSISSVCQKETGRGFPKMFQNQHIKLKAKYTVKHDLYVLLHVWL